MDQSSTNALEDTPNFLSENTNQPERQRDQVVLKQPPPLTGANDPEEEIQNVVNSNAEANPPSEPTAETVKEYERIESERAKVPKEFPQPAPETAEIEKIKVGEWLPAKHDHCTPTCTWSCNIPKCDEVCSPVCQAPKCETRCSGMSTRGCVMACAKPHCMVMCPKRGCPSGGCPSCTTQCSEPECHMKCPKSKLCKSVCEQPQCEWNCKVPQCPKPRCHMVCESAKKCGSASFSQELPPLLPGQTAVQTFAANVPLSAYTVDKKPMSEFQNPNKIQQTPAWTAPSMMDVTVRSVPQNDPMFIAETAAPQTNMVTLPVYHEQPFETQAAVY